MYDEPEDTRWTCAQYLDAAQAVAATLGMVFFVLLAMFGCIVLGETLFSNDRACISGKLHVKQHSVWVQTDKLCVPAIEQENVQ